MKREPGPFTGGFDMLTPKQKRKQRALRIMGLELDIKAPRPNPPTFPIVDRASAAYQLQRARAARMFGWIDDATFAAVEAIARPLIDATPVQTTVDELASNLKPKHEPHPHEQRTRKK